MKLADHLFVSSTDGALFDTRVVDWFKHPLRAIYSRHFTRIRNTHELRATLRAGAFAWPGGYPLYFVTCDGCALSFDAVRANYAQVSRSTRDDARDGWRVLACEVNWEDNELHCEDTGAPIPSAYGTD